jgi:hypothetical protein
MKEIKLNSKKAKQKDELGYVGSEIQSKNNSKWI